MLTRGPVDAPVACRLGTDAARPNGDTPPKPSNTYPAVPAPLINATPCAMSFSRTSRWSSRPRRARERVQAPPAVEHIATRAVGIERETRSRCPIRRSSPRPRVGADRRVHSNPTVRHVARGRGLGGRREQHDTAGDVPTDPVPRVAARHHRRDASRRSRRARNPSSSRQCSWRSRARCPSPRTCPRWKPRRGANVCTPPKPSAIHPPPGIAATPALGRAGLGPATGGLAIAAVFTAVGGRIPGAEWLRGGLARRYRGRRAGPIRVDIAGAIRGAWTRRE